jgi:hypothetical protein
MKIKKSDAVALWDSLRDNFLNATNNIKAIISARAWEPLGYNSFAQAWREEMVGISLAGEIRVHVVYQLLEEQVPVQDIADMVGGVGPTLTESLARQKNNGVPADCAVVSEHIRRKPRPADTLHVKVGATMLYEYRRIAALAGESVEDIAMEAIREKFASLVAVQGGKGKTRGKAS